MTISPTARTSLALGTRPAGSPIGSKISNPKIMVIADSHIGVGIVATGNSWIQPVDAMLTASGITASWVGNLTTGSPARSHRGVAGSTVPNHRAGGSVDSTIYMATYTPDIIVVALGTNDGLTDTDRDNYDTNVAGLVAECKAAYAGLNRVVLCKTFATEDTTRAARIEVIANTEVPSAKTLIEATGVGVVVCDYRVLIPNGHLRRSEGTAKVHMESDDAYALSAECMFPAIVNACGYNAVWVGDTVS